MSRFIHAQIYEATDASIRWSSPRLLSIDYEATDQDPTTATLAGARLSGTIFVFGMRLFVDGTQYYKSRDCINAKEEARNKNTQTGARLNGLRCAGWNLNARDIFGRRGISVKLGSIRYLFMFSPRVRSLSAHKRKKERKSVLVSQVVLKFYEQPVGMS